MNESAPVETSRVSAIVLAAAVSFGVTRLSRTR